MISDLPSRTRARVGPGSRHSYATARPRSTARNLSAYRFFATRCSSTMPRRGLQSASSWQVEAESGARTPETFPHHQPTVIPGSCGTANGGSQVCCAGSASGRSASRRCRHIPQRVEGVPSPAPLVTGTLVRAQLRFHTVSQVTGSSMSRTCMSGSSARAARCEIARSRPRWSPRCRLASPAV